MLTTRTALHVAAAASGALAAAICMAVCQIVALALGAHLVDALLFGLSLSSIAFGGTYAGVFFVSLVHSAGRTAMRASA
jgi:hypothetical protein